MAEVNFLVKKGLTVPKGSAAAPSIIFDAADGDTGIYSPGVDQLAFSANGSGRLLVTGSSGTARATTFNATEALFIGSDSSSNERVAFGWSSAPGGTPLGHRVVGDGVNLHYYTRLGQSGSHIFSTNNAGVATERLRLTADGYARLAAGTGGIQFNGDTASANALDDYEEGSWTPVHSDGTNTATLSGLYRKIGSVVYIRVTATGTGTLKVGSVSGLPFTNIATIVGTGGKVVQATSATSDTSVIGYHAQPALINLNLSADVSVSAGISSWVCSITSVVF